MGYKLTMTNEGAALIASVEANQGTLTLTEMRFSETNYVGSEQTLTEGTFGGVFVTAPEAASVVDLTTIKVSAQFTNSGITGDHPLYSIGIIGTDGNTTALLGVSTTADPEAIIREPVPATSISTYAFNTNIAVSNTNDITVAGTTAAVLYDTDVVDNLISLATDKPLSANQGRVLKGNIDDNFSGQSNENLIDNPFFTVNQRGQANYTAYGLLYTVDRWEIASANTSLSVNASGVTFTRFDGYTGYFRQVLANTSIKGKKVTVSVLLQDNTLLSSTVTFPTSGTETLQFSAALNVNLTVSGSDCYFDVLGVAGATISLTAVKLELGSVSTLANDVAPDYAFELAKCRTSTADPSDTYANKGNLVNYADMTSIYATGSTNTTGAQIDAGTFFYLNGQFCKAIADIAVNATFTENTNYKNDTVGGELSNKLTAIKQGSSITPTELSFDVGSLTEDVYLLIGYYRSADASPSTNDGFALIKRNGSSVGVFYKVQFDSLGAVSLAGNILKVNIGAYMSLVLIHA